MKKHIASFFNDHKGARRLVLIWACWLFTVIVFRVTQPEVITEATAATATIIGTLVTLITIPIGFYFHHRKEGKDSGS